MHKTSKDSTDGGRTVTRTGIVAYEHDMPMVFGLKFNL